MATKDELHVVFNFFEKIAKPPEQESYEHGMRYIYDYVKTQPSFILGQLHKNLDPNGVFKYVNHVGFSNGDFHAFRQGPPPAEWIEVATKGMGPHGPGGLISCYPAGYAEVATTSSNPLVTTRPKDEKNSYYLLVNYKDSEVPEASYGAFEADWKTKTGATIITDAFPSDIKSGDIALYKRLRPGISPFVYVLRCEILPGASVENVLKLIPTLKEKLTAGGVPYSDVASYSICYLIGK